MVGTLRTLAVAGVSVLALVACGGGDTGGTTAVSGFPMTLDVCGEQVTFEKPPERVVLITRYSLPTLQSVGATDTIVAKAGEFPPELYDQQTRAALDAIPTIGGPESSTGSVQVSLEVLLAQNPDLVIGEPEAVDMAGLAQVGIPFIPYSFAQCPNPPPLYQDLSFDAVYDQVELYGRIFDRPQRAAGAVASLKQRVAAVTAAVPRNRPPRSAAALFVPVGGGQLYAAGGDSMGEAAMQAAGLANVFGDLSGGGVAEVGFESVLASNPDVLVVTTTVNLDDARVAFLALPGAQSLDAVRNNTILLMKYDYTDPPTPLSVEGLEMIAEAFGAGP